MENDSTARHQPLLDSGDYSSSSPNSRAAGSSSSLSSIDRVRNSPNLLTYVAVGLILITVIVIGLIAVAIRRDDEHPSVPSNGSARSPAEITECLLSHSTTRHPPTANPRPPNPSTPALLLRNATIHDGRDPTPYTADILLTGGLIDQIGFNLPAPPNPNATIDLEGRHVTPGLVDMHSHIGVYAWPGDLWATQDGNEMTNVVFPQVRAIDALNPQDRAILWTRLGGVTTSLILPGSGNAMGGEATIIKHLNSTYVRDLLLPEAPRGLKMACGENPKRVYGMKGQTPMSRMGVAWVMREIFEKARALHLQQQDWCGSTAPAGDYPNQLGLDSLVALLKGEARLHQHCYMVHDFQMVLRLAEEFGYSVSAFHHSLEAWKIPALLTNVTIATWADWWGFKHEAYDGSVHAPAILHNANVKVAIKSDDDVVSRYLMFETAKAVHYRLDPGYAIQAVTSVPAAAMGLQNRLGSIVPGMDGDLVVWDRHPLVLGARPDKVIIDGVVVEDRHITGPPAPYPSVAAPLTCTPGAPPQTLDCYVVRGVQLWTMLANGTAPPISNGVIVVIDGFVNCAAADCTTPPGRGCVEWVMTAPATAVPGFIEAGSHIGQFEIGSEAVTWDGVTDGAGAGGGGEGGYGVVSAMDGIHQDMRHVSSARKGGVLTAISSPMSSQMIAGVSTAFLTLTSVGNGTLPVFIDETLVQHRVALHIQFGNTVKTTGLSASISGQAAALRRALARGYSLVNNTALTPLDPDWPLQQVALGRLPVSMEVHGADEIRTILRVHRQFPFRLIIQGGAEAWLVANFIAAASRLAPVWVVLTSRVPPSSFETYRSSDTGLSVLRRAGVQWALQSASEDNARNLRWEAGWQKEYNGLSTAEAVAGITVNVRRAFGLTESEGLGEIRMGSVANFVVYDGDPLGVESHVQLVAIYREVECRPMQY